MGCETCHGSRIDDQEVDNLASTFSLLGLFGCQVVSLDRFDISDSENLLEQLEDQSKSLSRYTPMLPSTS